MKNKQLEDVFIPFHYVSSTTSILVKGVWGCVFIFLWMNAPVLIPAPLEAAKQWWAYFSDPEFYSDVFASVFLTLEGMLLSIVISCILAYLSVISAFKPVAYFITRLRYMSIAGFMFTFTLLMHGDAGDVKLALLVFGVVPFFTLTLLGVIERIDQREFDLWTTLRYNKWEQLFYIVIWGKLDLTLEAIRSNFAMAWLMIIAVESFSMSSGGVGVLLYKAAGKTQVDKVFALQFGCILLLGIGFDYLLRFTRLKLFPYVALTEQK